MPVANPFDVAEEPRHEPTVAVSATVAERRITIEASSPEPRDRLVLRITSNRNRRVPALTDTSPHAPQGRPVVTLDELDNEQIWFPVMDLAPTPQMSAIATFELRGQSVKYAVNSMYYPDLIPLHESEARIPGAMLEPWENSMFVVGDAVLTGWMIELEWPATGGTARFDVTVLSDHWAGVAEILDEETREVLARTEIESRAVPVRPATSNYRGLAAERLTAALSEVVAYVTRSQVVGSAHAFEGGFHVFYDHDARTFRSPHWNWAWGPAIKLLIDADSLLNHNTERSGLEIATTAGLASLRLQQRNQDHPAFGFSMVRYSPSIAYRREQPYLSPSSPDFPVSGWAPSHTGEPALTGYEHYYGPADTLFLAGWAWLPLAEKTGNQRFLDASRLAAASSEQLLDTFQVIPQDYPLAMGRWTPYTREESAFGLEGLSELYRVTGDPRVRDLGIRYMEELRLRLERPDGLWNRHVWHDSRPTTSCEYKARSLGWVGEGLIAAHRMAPGEGYLERAERLAEHFLRYQRQSGAWGLVINDHQSVDSAKGTALWCLLMYRLHAYSQDPRHLHSARRAMQWLLDEQYLGEDGDGRGGTISCSPFSGVDYRRWFRLSCLYTSGFFGLALIEELRLQHEAV